jgi:hypothetical protein
MFDLYETHHDDMGHLDGSSDMPSDEVIDEHSNFRSYPDKLGFRSQLLDSNAQTKDGDSCTTD